MLECLLSSLVEVLLCMYLLFFSVYKREGKGIGLSIHFGETTSELVSCGFPVANFRSDNTKAVKDFDSPSTKIFLSFKSE